MMTRPWLISKSTLLSSVDRKPDDSHVAANLVGDSGPVAESRRSIRPEFDLEPLLFQHASRIVLASMADFIITFALCVISLIVIGCGIHFQIWKRPAFPLVAFCIIVPIEWGFDWAFIRHYDNEISVKEFWWANPQQNAEVAVKELTARIIIETVEFLRAIAVLWVFCVATYVVMHSWSAASGKQRRCLIAAVFSAILLFGILWEGLMPGVPNPWTNKTLFVEFTNFVKVYAGRPDFAAPIRHPMSIASHFGLIFAAFATGLVMAKPGGNVADLQTQNRFLALLLYSCAAVCVLHVMSMGVFQLRAAALLSKPTEADLVRRLAATISVGNAVSYICILLVFHVPAVHVLTAQAWHITPDRFKGQKQSEWLEKNRLNTTWPQFYAQVATMLSPLIAGFPLSKLLGLILG